MTTFKEAISQSRHLVNETAFVSRNYGSPIKPSSFNRRDFMEFSIASLDGVCAQTEHLLNSSKGILLTAVETECLLTNLEQEI